MLLLCPSTTDALVLLLIYHYTTPTGLGLHSGKELASLRILISLVFFVSPAEA